MNDLTTIASVIELNRLCSKLVDTQDDIASVIGELQKLFSEHVKQTQAYEKRIADLESQLNRVPLGNIHD